MIRTISRPDIKQIRLHCNSQTRQLNDCSQLTTQIQTMYICTYREYLNYKYTLRVFSTINFLNSTDCIEMSNKIVV